MPDFPKLGSGSQGSVENFVDIVLVPTLIKLIVGAKSFEPGSFDDPIGHVLDRRFHFGEARGEKSHAFVLVILRENLFRLSEFRP